MSPANGNRASNMNRACRELGSRLDLSAVHPGAGIPLDRLHQNPILVQREERSVQRHVKVKKIRTTNRFRQIRPQERARANTQRIHAQPRCHANARQHHASAFDSQTLTKYAGRNPSRAHRSKEKRDMQSGGRQDHGRQGGKPHQVTNRPGSFRYDHVPFALYMATPNGVSLVHGRPDEAYSSLLREVIGNAFHRIATFLGWNRADDKHAVVHIPQDDW